MFQKKIIVTLSKGKQDGKAQYKLKAVKENILGKLLNEKQEELEDGVFREILPNVYEYTFIPSAVTDNGLIKFEAQDNHGQKKTAEVKISVKRTGFEFDLSPSTTTALMNKATSINFSIKPFDASTASKNYQMKFSSSLEGTLNGRNAEEYFEVKEGEFNLPYIGTVSGEHLVKVSVKDEFGGSTTKEFKITIEKNTFDFAVSSQNLNPIIGETSLLHFIITSSNQNTQTYQMKYQVLEGGVVLMDSNGGEILPNNLFTIGNKEFAYAFKTTKGGKSRVKFTIVNSDGFQVEKEIEFNTQIPEFTFSASAIKVEQSKNEANILNYILQKIGSTPQSFQLKFETTGEATLNGVAKNVWFYITSGGFSFEIVPTEVGENEITVKVANDYGVEKTVTLKLNVANYDFDFTAVATQSTTNINEIIPFNFNIRAIGNDAEQGYSMMYVVEKGQSNVEGYSQGVYKTVSKGDFSINVTPTSVGEISIRFTVRNSVGKTHEQVVNLTSSLPDFNFTVASTKTNVTAGEIVPLNAQLSAIGSDIGQSYEIMFTTPRGNAEVEGLTKGVWKTVEKGTFVLNAKILDGGENEINFQVRNTARNSKTQSVYMNAIKPTILIERYETDKAEFAPDGDGNLSVIIRKTPKFNNTVKYKTWVTGMSDGAISTGLNHTNNNLVEGNINDNGLLKIPLNPNIEGNYTYNVQAIDEFGNESNVVSIPVIVKTVVELNNLSATFGVWHQRIANSGDRQVYFRGVVPISYHLKVLNSNIITTTHCAL